MSKSKLTLAQQFDRETVEKQLKKLLGKKLEEPYTYKYGPNKGKQTNKVTQQVLGEIAGLTEGHGNVPYTTKQVYNWINEKSEMPQEAREALISFFSLESDYFEHKITKEDIQRQEIQDLFQGLQSSSQTFGEEIISGMDLYGRPLDWNDVISDPREDTVSTLALLRQFDPEIDEMIEEAKTSKTATINFYRLGFMFQNIIEQLWKFFKIQGQEYLKHTGKFPDGSFYDFEDAGERYSFIVSCSFNSVCDPQLKFFNSLNNDFYTKVPYKESNPAPADEKPAEQDKKGK